MKIIYVKLSDCSGCMINFLPLLEKLNLEIVYFPNVVDDGEIREADVAIINGAVAKESEEHMGILKRVREASKWVAAIGSCSSVGGITRYLRGGQNPTPSHITFLPVGDVIEVDFAIPGCPASTDIMEKFLKALEEGNEKYLTPFRNLAKKRKAGGLDLQDEIVSAGLCSGCGMCALSCPVGAIEIVKGRPEVRMEKCIRCGTCYFRCPRMFIRLRKPDAEVA
ncbi:MAG: 4Fe-4S binding protein [Thermoplasmata archaeon]|nr:4Fe-4S binding protein [Thermoplasmata archaeon]